MDYYDRRNARYDCRSAGTVLGAVGILASIGCGLLFTYIFLSMGATEFGLAVGAISGKFRVNDQMFFFLCVCENWHE